MPHRKTEMKKSNINSIVAGILLAGSLQQGARAQSSDAIIDKLVDKGILTVDEANDLRNQADKGYNTAHQVKTGLPDWVTTLRIGGDMRGRYDLISAEEATFTDRSRFRYRIRPFIIATIKDDFEVGLRLTSAEQAGGNNALGGDPISGNVTESGNGSKKFIYIDQAYGKWNAINSSLWNASFTVGKMENPFVLSDMVFDPDYTPEGFAQQFGFNAGEAHQLKLNLGEFSIQEVANSSADSFMLGAQIRVESTWNKRIATSIGLSGLTLTSKQNLNEPQATGTTLDTTVTPNVLRNTATANTLGTTTVPNVNGGNTRVWPSGALVYDYNPFVVDAAFTYTLDRAPLYNAAFPIRLAADYMQNPAAPGANEGYSVGITFGKSGKKGLWDLGYRYKYLEGDAWYEEVVDSDFGGLRRSGTAAGRAAYLPGTNVKGHIFKLNYSPYDSVTIGVTYFLAQLIDFNQNRLEVPPPGLNNFVPEHPEVSRLQVDVVWKF